MKTHKYMKGLYCIVIVLKNRLTFDSASLMKCKYLLRHLNNSQVNVLIPASTRLLESLFEATELTSEFCRKSDDHE